MALRSVSPTGRSRAEPRATTAPSQGGGGAAVAERERGPDEVFHLGHATEQEIRRLATHPVHEVERLREEARQGEAGTTLTILVGGVAIWVALVVATILALVLVIASLVGRS